MFDADQGYRGSMQFLFGRQVEPLTADPNGFEMDSDIDNASPGSNVRISNATLCGTGAQGTDATYGMVLRENLEGSIMNLIVTLFDTGVDARNDFGTPTSPNVALSFARFFESNIAANNIANPGETDNDMGFDEAAWFNATGSNNAETKPAGFGDCSTNPPVVAPTAAVTGGTPPTGMDTSATYIGAFEDASDMWMTGAWIDWAAN
jgi:hypothetical protein